jgi:hypothetical protein
MSDGENVCFVCKGCGRPAFYFGAGLPPHQPPGAVGHSKPLDAVRPLGNLEPSRVRCALYLQTTAAEFWDLHRDAKRLEYPSELTPVLP